jgi:hypothetical protein
MTAQEAKQVLDKIVGQVFGYRNPYTLEQFQQKYAFDIRLPSEVFDSTTGEPTWASSTNPTKFMTLTNTREFLQESEGMLAKRELPDIQSILAAWNETNYTATERNIESINVHESDCVQNSENVYRSQDVNNCKNIIFCDGMQPGGNEFMVASQRSRNSTYGIRIDDSQNISNSFSVSWSNKVSNSLFINDCYDMTDCMFCSHIAGKQYCIANMQYTEVEYKKLRDLVNRWVLTA